jgi:hypothetical protein
MADQDEVVEHGAHHSGSLAQTTNGYGSDGVEKKRSYDGTLPAAA